MEDLSIYANCSSHADAQTYTKTACCMGALVCWRGGCSFGNFLVIKIKQFEAEVVTLSTALF